MASLNSTMLTNLGQWQLVNTSWQLILCRIRLEGDTFYIYTSFELFQIKERDIPIEALKLENKNDKIIAFSWEPKGHMFDIIHGDGPIPYVSFYSKP